MWEIICKIQWGRVFARALSLSQAVTLQGYGSGAYAMLCSAPDMDPMGTYTKSCLLDSGPNLGWHLRTYGAKESWIQALILAHKGPRGPRRLIYASILPVKAPRSFNAIPSTQKIQKQSATAYNGPRGLPTKEHIAYCGPCGSITGARVSYYRPFRDLKQRYRFSGSSRLIP